MVKRRNLKEDQLLVDRNMLKELAALLRYGVRHPTPGTPSLSSLREVGMVLQVSPSKVKLLCQEEMGVGPAYVKKVLRRRPQVPEEISSQV